jgi:hypothetical protein
MPVVKTNVQEIEKRRRRLKLTQKKAAALLAKKNELDEKRKAAKRRRSKLAGTQTPTLPDPLHPVAEHIVKAVAHGHLEEVAIYEPAEELKTPPAEKTWWQSLREYWDMIGKM